MTTAGRTPRRMLIAAVAVLAAGCGESASRDVAAPRPAPESVGGHVLIAAGDIAGCDTNGDEATAEILDRERPDTVATLGDNAYEYGTPEQFRECYGPNWGRFKDKTRPSVGNHEYAEENAPGYFGYFGRAAGRARQGWYSYDVAGWHVVVLNSMCEKVGCGPGSPQLRWLRRDLARDDSACTLAYWHHPRFSSGSEHGDEPRVAPFWRALQRDGADLILSGHDHSYERFAPLTADGRPSARGIRQIVVGTGGRSLRPFGDPDRGSLVRSAETYGVLRLTLRERGYDWRFLPVAGGSFTDAGSGRCR